MSQFFRDITGSGAEVVETLTGDSGGAVVPTAGNINVLGTTDQITTTGSGSTLTLAFPSTGIRSFRPIVTQSGTNTFALTDANTFQLCTAGAGMNLTVPANATVAFPVGTEIDVFQEGAGQVTFVAAVGVTINSDSGNLKLSAQYVGASLKKTATNTWALVGSLTA